VIGGLEFRKPRTSDLEPSPVSPFLSAADSELRTQNSELLGPSRLSRSFRMAILLGRASGRSLSADRSPTSLGIHEGSFEAFAFFAELQTIFLDPAIDFPP